MKKNLVLAIVFLAVVQFSFGQVKWNMDPMHSNVRFDVEHTGISFVDGEFEKMDGSMESKSKDDFEGATFNYKIDVNSINTRIEARDDHLKTDDFFNAEKYPEIKFENAKLVKKYGDHYTLEGDLTIRDVTKKVAFDTKMNGTMTDEDGKEHVGFTATTTIDRTDFNINYGDKLPSGIDAVGKYIEITVNTELIEQ